MIINVAFVILMQLFQCIKYKIQNKDFCAIAFDVFWLNQVQKEGQPEHSWAHQSNNIMWFDFPQDT